MSHFDDHLEDLPEMGVSGARPKSRLADSDSNEPPSPSTTKNGKRAEADVEQWTRIQSGTFTPSGRSYAALPPGFYYAGFSNGMICAFQQALVTDHLESIPGSCNEYVLQGIRRFWDSRNLYRRYGLSYKRGVLFHGPPGSGKTATISLLTHELIHNYGGLVFNCINVSVLSTLLHQLRIIEPDRPLIIIMEDLDELIQSEGEAPLLSLLDGEAQIDNVVFLASTNYVERLGARIVNRPSRFDERIKVGMPTALTRRAYLQIVTRTEPLTESQLDLWTHDTEGMSIAHLRELVVAVRCLGRSYEDTLKRLSSMKKKPEASREMSSEIGLKPVLA